MHLTMTRTLATYWECPCSGWKQPLVMELCAGLLHREFNWLVGLMDAATA